MVLRKSGETSDFFLLGMGLLIVQCEGCITSLNNGRKKNASKTGYHQACGQPIPWGGEEACRLVGWGVTPINHAKHTHKRKKKGDAPQSGTCIINWRGLLA
ncbi:hypothetical protein BC940DRAFT_302048, partial [Gongronella butleri]